MKTLNYEQQITDLLSDYPLCDACLGRLFRETQKKGTNAEKGVALRTHYKISKKTEEDNCWLCRGLLKEIPHFAQIITHTLQDYEFQTFLIGSKVEEEIQEKEHHLWIRLGLENPEPLKMEINRQIGKILEPQLNKVVNILTPDIMVILDTAFDTVSLQISSLYIYGRYKKFKRGIPQTKWPCSICRGKGCKRCNYTGRLYETSVEELIGKHAVRLTQGTDESFHGSGREDIDALMLGSGRPFVLEIKNPKIRTINLQLLEETTNQNAEGNIAVTGLRITEKDEVARLKAAEFRKIYRVTLEAAQPFNKEKLIKVAQTLQGKLIKQLTPTRVAHRRANKVRERTIYNCDIESVQGAIARLTLETEAGTYVKEFISGDSNKTQPNFSELIGIPCIVKELDVIDVKGE